MDVEVSTMTDIILKHKGTLDKFVGDALMAVWGTLAEEADDGAAKAVHAAADMLRELDAYNRETGVDRPTLRIGIGVNTGPVVAGFMGSHSRRLEFTVVGDTVNIASRLCSMAKAGEVLVSTHTWERVDVAGETLGEIQLKGKARPVGIYRLTTGSGS